MPVHPRVRAQNDVVDGSGSYARLNPLTKTVALGTSITAGSGPGTSYYEMAVARSGGRLFNLSNAGVPGNTTTQMLARFATDVTPLRPDILLIEPGPNDFSAGISRATSLANVQAMITAAKPLGSVVVIISCSPNTTSRASVQPFNAGLASLARLNGALWVDLYQPLVDPSTGTYITGFSGDGVHPLHPACAIMADVLLDALDSLTGNSSALLASDNTDSNNLLTNGLFLASGSGLGTGWTVVNTPAGAAHSIITGDQSIKGNWQRITMTSATDYHAIVQGPSAGFAVGDKLLMSGRFSAHDIAGTGSWAIFVWRNGSFSTLIFQDVKANLDGVFQYLYTVPAGTTSIGLGIRGQGSGGGGSVTLDVAQMGVDNLTTRGQTA